MSLITTGLLPPEFSESGTEMMTPFPVPIHNRCKLIIIDVMRTNEKPSLPVPFSIQQCELFSKFKSYYQYRAFLKHKVQRQRPEDGDNRERETAGLTSLVGSISTLHHQPNKAAEFDFLYVGEPRNKSRKSFPKNIDQTIDQSNRLFCLFFFFTSTRRDSGSITAILLRKAAHTVEWTRVKQRTATVGGASSKSQ